MRNKVYQITVDEAYFKRVRRSLSLAVLAHSDYAESKNINTWDDPISQCLANNLFHKHKELDDLLDELFSLVSVTSEEVSHDNS